MSKRNILAGVARFAHLLGNTASRAEDPKDEDPDAPVQGEDESDEDFAKRCDEYEKDKKAKSAKKEGEGDDADGDDADAEDEDESEEAKAARKAERARCAAIFGTKAAATRPDMAAHLAFETGMKASAAIKMLGAIAAGQPKGAALASRMASVRQPIVGNDESRASAPPSNAAAATAKAISAAAARARGEKPAAS